MLVFSQDNYACIFSIYNMILERSSALNGNFFDLIGIQKRLIEISYMDYDKKTVCRVYPCLHDILYISAKNVYSHIYFTKEYALKASVKNNVLYVAKSIGFFEDKLQLHGFFRISKSCLINLAQVVMYQENGFVILNEIAQPLKVAEEMRGPLKNSLKDFCVTPLL
jgi:hypothetical protein